MTSLVYSCRCVDLGPSILAPPHEILQVAILQLDPPMRAYITKIYLLLHYNWFIWDTNQRLNLYEEVLMVFWWPSDLEDKGKQAIYTQGRHVCNNIHDKDAFSEEKLFFSIPDLDPSQPLSNHSLN